MNMPLYSPRDAGRELKGWAWGMAPHACKAGIKYRRGEDGSVEHGPAVGDQLLHQIAGSSFTRRERTPMCAFSSIMALISMRWPNPR